MKPVTQYEEVMKALERVDEFLENRKNSTAAPEFEDLDDAERPWRTEYMHESITESETRYRRSNADV